VALKVLECFSAVSGLQLNLSKTEGLGIGSLKGMNNQSITKIKWTQTPIRYLGIHIGHETLLCEKLNWTSKIEELQKLLDSWRTRNLSLQGKILIIKTLALPKLVYSASMLEIPDNIVKKINKIIYTFLWGKVDKIERNVLINDYENGGLRMIDIESHFMSLKAAWIPRIYNNSNDTWTHIPLTYIQNITNGYLFDMKIPSVKKMPRMNMIPPFYQEVILAFCKANNNVINNKSTFFQQIIWGNNNFLVNGTCLYSQSFIDSGFIFICDILNQDGHFKDDIFTKLKCKHHYLRVIEIIKLALKPYKSFRFNDDAIIQYDKQTCDLTDKKSKYFYSRIVKNKQRQSKAIRKWSEYFDIHVDWTNVYAHKIYTQLEMKIADFNYKMLHNIIPTGKNLLKWKKIDNASCIYCKIHIHDLKHMLWDCSCLNDIWKVISDALNCVINFKMIILGGKRLIHENRSISLVCYLIFKKYLLDKERENNNFTPLFIYIKYELTFRLKIYESLKYPVNQTALIQKVIQSCSSV
ncbi:MAG: hypothetical protein GY702_00255, partial [Desulfobulbaceae bacterium]|nr:hypothetical protein [Desulfobulbaceae bacterium]